MLAALAILPGQRTNRIAVQASCTFGGVGLPWLCRQSMPRNGTKMLRERGDGRQSTSTMYPEIDWGSLETSKPEVRLWRKEDAPMPAQGSTGHLFSRLKLRKKEFGRDEQWSVQGRKQVACQTSAVEIRKCSCNCSGTLRKRDIAIFHVLDGCKTEGLRFKYWRCGLEDTEALGWSRPSPEKGPCLEYLEVEMTPLPLAWHHTRGGHLDRSLANQALQDAGLIRWQEPNDPYSTLLSAHAGPAAGGWAASDLRLRWDGSFQRPLLDAAELRSASPAI
ncbi:hypothetical protein NDU88_000874 [Pleurodeles waltl]|uniref:Uncharacterized protein n=1 Tax=Pleurodeles waltl TaxID=8319 RepID=A0AAV7LBG8_PLEWA|nr:hypothetical protein NDU88_000874 [Pleurodeles waltl]